MLDGATDDDGTVPLAVGENVISVLVTAEDGETTRTYTVTVTRAEAATSGPTVAIALSPSDTMIEGEGTEIAVTLSFGNLTFDDDRATTDYTFRADVKDSEDGTPTGARNECERPRPRQRPLYVPGGRGPGNPQRHHLRRLSGGGLYPPGQYLQRRQRGTGLGHRRVLRPPAAHVVRGGRSGHRFGRRSPAATSPCTVPTPALTAYGPTGPLSGCPIRATSDYMPTH